MADDDNDDQLKWRERVAKCSDGVVMVVLVVGKRSSYCLKVFLNFKKTRKRCAIHFFLSIFILGGEIVKQRRRILFIRSLTLFRSI